MGNVRRYATAAATLGTFMGIIASTITVAGPSVAEDTAVSNEAVPESGQTPIMPCSGNQKKKYALCINVYNNNAYDIEVGTGDGGAQLALLPMGLQYVRQIQYADDWAASPMNASSRNAYNGQPWSSMSRTDADSMEVARNSATWIVDNPNSYSQLAPTGQPYAYSAWSAAGYNKPNEAWSPLRGYIVTNKQSSWNPSHHTKYAYNHTYGFHTLPLKVHIANNSTYTLLPMSTGADGGNFLPSYLLGRNALESSGSIAANGNGYVGGWISQVQSSSDLYPRSNYQLSFYAAAPAPSPSSPASKSPSSTASKTASPTNTDFPDAAANGSSGAKFVIDLNIVMERSTDGGMSFANSYCTVVGKTTVRPTCTIVGLPNDNSTSFLQPSGWNQINVEIKGGS